MNARQKTKLRNAFKNLKPGDVITPLGFQNPIVVLKNKDDSKVLGQVCVCGQHVNFVPFHITWSEQLFMPVTREGRPVFPTWEDISIDKNGRPDLADKYQHLLVNDDFDNASMEELVGSFTKNNQELTEIAIEIESLVDADDSVKMVSMLRTLGATIPDEVAATVISIMKTGHEFDENSLSAIVGAALARRTLGL